MPKINRECERCGKPFQTLPYEVKRGKGRFCSIICSGKTRAETEGMPRIGSRPSTKAERVRAHGLINMRVRRGQIIKPKTCHDCGEGGKRLYGHHEDYSKPDVVEWLCQSCHMKRHFKEYALVR